MANLVTTTTNTTDYDPFLKSTLTNLVTAATGQANQAYTPYTGQRIADMTPDELLAYQQIRSGNLSEMPLFEKAAGAYDSGLSTLNNLQGMNSWNNDAASQYMNPYIKQVVNSTVDQASRQNQQQLNALRSNQKLTGAFGGSRGAIGEAALLDNANRSLQDTVGKLYSTGYENAQNQFNTDREAQQKLVGLYGGAASGLSGLAGSQSAYRAGQSQDLMTSGQNQRTYAQSNLDQAYQDFTNQRDWGKNQLSFLSDILAGNSLSNAATGATQTVTPTYPSQSGLQSTLGSISAGLGLASNLSNAFGSLFGSNSKARGGLVKEYAEGGLTTINKGRPSYAEEIYAEDPRWIALLKSLSNSGQGLGREGIDALVNGGQYIDDLLRYPLNPVGVPNTETISVPDIAPRDIQRDPIQDIQNIPGLGSLGSAEGDSYAPTKIRPPAEQNTGTYDSSNPGITLANIFQERQPTFAEQAFEANPLLMTGLAMLGSNAENNPYDTWGAMANSAYNALDAYDKRRLDRAQTDTQRQAAIAGAINNATQNMLQHEANVENRNARTQQQSLQRQLEYDKLAAQQQRAALSSAMTVNQYYTQREKYTRLLMEATQNQDVVAQKYAQDMLLQLENLKNQGLLTQGTGNLVGTTEEVNLE